MPQAALSSRLSDAILDSKLLYGLFYTLLSLSYFRTASATLVVA